MDPRPRSRPQLEALEDRSLPNNLLGHLVHPGSDLLNPSAHKHEEDAATLQAVMNSQAANNPGIAPIQSNPYGASYGVWSARWWQYAYSLPVDQSPFIDNTGANFPNGQSGKVLYLAGVITPNNQPNTGEPVHRTITVPSGTSLFLPVVNAEWDNVNPGIGTAPPGPDFTFTETELRGFAAGFIDEALNNGSTSLKVDGRSVQNLDTYRATSPAFSYTMPANNIYTAFGLNVPARTVPLAVSDGIWAMLRPLSVGQHTVQIQASVPAFGFSLDVTYHVTVKPGH